MTEPFLALPAIRQAELIRRREISSLELIESHLRRIDALQPRINAVTAVFADQALDAARAADRAAASGEFTGPLHGVPFSVKDSIEIKGVACTAGTLGRAHVVAAAEDATLVARLRKAGAIPIAKTNLPDLLFAFESGNLLFGATNNPYDPTRTSGGSSGGEAALIAACGSPMGLGSDAAGSVRLPAAFCGIAGIKPTSGRLSRAGHFPPAGGWIEALWQIGPLARTVGDISLMMATLAGSDVRDACASPAALGDPAAVDIAALRVAVYTNNGFAPADAEVSAVVESAASRLAGAGAIVRCARPSCTERAYDLEMSLLGADGGDALWSYLEALGSTRVHPLLRGWLEKLEPYRKDLKGFQSVWAEWDQYRAEMYEFLRGYDAILCPAYTHPAIPHGASIPDENFRGFSHTMAFNVAGWPACVVRCGESASGLPIAVQVAAGPWREDIVLAVAAFLESECGGWKAPALIDAA